MKYDLVCFCHLRWNFVYQRPQHLLSRFARYQRVFVVEEPIFGAYENHLEVSPVENNQIWVAVPHLRNDLNEKEVIDIQRLLVDDLIRSFSIDQFIAWYYSPMPIAFSEHLSPVIIVYDCMDELSAFNNAPPSIISQEKELFTKADIVFTGGYSLYNAKRAEHANIFPMPSSIDKDHFTKARKHGSDPEDQASISFPRIGYYGVIDERLDIQLVNEIADLRPGWQLIFLGPVVKIDPAILPRKNNIHYLGHKQYEQLPRYLSGWDVAMMPFALNRSTQFISPTKTPEFLAGGKRVVSTPIADVINPYGKEGLVFIADNPGAFVTAIESALDSPNDQQWLKETDHFLSANSWDKTWKTMMQLISLTIEDKSVPHPKNLKAYV